jgi:hypothetical protein
MAVLLAALSILFFVFGAGIAASSTFATLIFWTIGGLLLSAAWKCRPVIMRSRREWEVHAIPKIRRPDVR